MIFESIIATKDADGKAHLSPLGYRFEGEQIVLAPFVPSNTLDNLRRDKVAVLNFTDDVRVFAGCLTGRRAWPVVKATKIDGWRLEDSLAYAELQIEHIEEDPVRPKFLARIVHEVNHQQFRGFNRAQAAVVEAAILATRLDWLEPDKVQNEMNYLAIAIEKTGGPAETEAWQWLVEKMIEHPRHKHLNEHFS